MRFRLLFIVGITLSFLLPAASQFSVKSFDELPDLVIELSIPSKAKAGIDIGRDIKLVAKNIGKATAHGSVDDISMPDYYMIDFILSSDEIVPKSFARYSSNFFEDVLLRGGRVSRTLDLAPGKFRKYLNGAGIPADTPAGNYFICAQIDPGKKVIESDEDNNVICSSIEVENP
jgi:hypothetical protein